MSALVNAGFAYLLLAACGGADPARDPNLQVQSTPHAHPNGLHLLVPESAYRVIRTAEGFVAEPALGNENRRDPLVVSIRLRAEPPDSASVRKRHLAAGRTLRYSVTQDEDGGSGGVDYTLLAFEQVGTYWIHYRQRKQSEYGEPNFELWEIADGVRYAPSGSR